MSSFQIQSETFPRGTSTTVFDTQSDLFLWQDRRDQARRDRRRYEPIWALCQSFIANKQWVGWSKRDRRIVSDPNPQKRERHTVNVLTSYLMTNVGKFMSDDMRPQLFFRNDSIESRDFAKQANGAVEYCWEEEIDADAMLYDAILRMCSFGLSAVQTGWDSLSGPVIHEGVPYVDGKPMLDPAQRSEYMASNYGSGQQIDVRPVRGRCAWRVWSPQNILPPPGIENERDFPWLIIERPVALTRLRDLFGDKAEGIQEQNLAAVDMVGLRDMVTDSESASQGSRLRDHAIVYSGYAMPDKRHPKGQTVTWAGDRMLQIENRLPLDLDGDHKIGIQFFKYNPVPGRFWPIGLVEPGIGPQRQRNKSRSQYIEMKDRAGLGRVYARPNSLNITTLEGGKIFEVIEVRPGTDFPVETPGTGPGPWMAQDIAMHDSDLDKVMGIGQVTLGQQSGGASAYSAMALLAEQDDRRVSQIIKQIRGNVEWLVRYTLQDIRTYWPTDKQITLAGSNGEVNAYTFNATKLPSSVLVRVGTGAPAPRNQAAELQKIFDLYDRSISGGQALPIQWLFDSIEGGKALPIPEAPAAVQVEKADLENMIIGRGGHAEVSQYDDHDIHIREHQIAVQQHAIIPEATDVVRALVEHIQEHEEAKKATAAPAATAPGLQGGFGQQGGAATGVPGQTPAAPGMLPPPPSGPPQA